MRALLDAGHRVRAADMVFGPSLEGLEIERVEIDVLDRASLDQAFVGVDVVFHLAAIISIVGDPSGMVRRVNVDGPAHAAAAALAAGVDRFVHCSSAHAFDLERCGPELDESCPRSEGTHSPAYDRSKYEGECEVQRVVEAGLDAVIVNPSAIIGPFDFGPSRMGELFLQLRAREMPVNVSAGFDWVDVRDVADGLMAGAQRGRTGENYILSGQRHSMKELAVLAQEATGVARPRFSVPLGLVKRLVPVITRLTPDGQIPLFTADSMHALEFSPEISHHKATAELGYNPRTTRATVHDSFAWFEENGS